MKKLIFSLTMFLSVMLTYTQASNVFAACDSGQYSADGACRVIITTNNTNSAGTGNSASGANLGYTALEPIPGLTSGTDLTSAGSLPKIINAIFRILITAGALIAVLSLTIGGIQYMTASAVGNKTAGLSRARASLWGILLIAATWLILHTVNPKLLDFDLNPCPAGVCKSAGGSTFTPAASLGSGTTGTSGSGSTNGVIPSPYGIVYAKDNTNTNNATGCTNVGGTWSYNWTLTGGSCNR